MKSVTKIIGSSTYTIDHYYNGKECYPIVKRAAVEYWQNSMDKPSSENYLFGRDAESWSLGPMLLHDSFTNGYTVLSIDGVPRAFAGVRKHTDDIAFALTRLFCFFTVKPISYGLILPFHLEIAKEHGYKKAWVTFNEYNIHLYNTWVVKEFNSDKKHKRNNLMYEENDRMVSTHKYLGEMMLNGTKQTVIEWDL